MSIDRGGPRAIPLAVVGVGALFPGSVDAEDLWRNVLIGANLMSDVPPQYWRPDDYYDADPTAPLKTYARRGGFLPKVAFDSLANGIPPANVPMTDASQLLGLIVAKRALEDACGLDLGRLNRERTAVILGVATGTALLSSMNASLQRPIWTRALRESGLPEPQVQSICAAIEASYTPWTESTFPGLLGNVVAGRIASRFDLGGANCTVDAACASSLAALRMAAQELRLGAADLVITGGVDATNDPMMFVCFSKTPALSRSGACRPFSADADGTMLGEGAGMFALRRLADAERDGDPIYAVIRGLGASSDGRAKSIYAPRAEGQMRALRGAYAEAGYPPYSVELLEAHGTGTNAGDAAEIEALKAVFVPETEGAAGWCALGSIKSQIGHTKGAAGAASLCKVVMALHHKALPPTINVSRPNPELGLEGSPFALNAAARPWIRGRDQPRRAGVSSFGFGGSNYHVTLEEYLGAARPRRIRAMPTELVLASGQDVPACVSSAREIVRLAEAPTGFAHAAQVSQRAFDPSATVRAAFVVEDAAELAIKIEEVGRRLPAAPIVRAPRAAAAAEPAVPGRVAFLFPGQGSQYVDMGADLALAFDLAREVWDAAASDATPDIADIHRFVFPPTAFEENERARQESALTGTEIAQPAIGITSQMMLALLRSAGLRPDAVAGHSFGELPALYCAGALEAAAMRSASRCRGEFMAAAARRTEGGMLAVFHSAADVEALLAQVGSDGVIIANRNAPEQVVLAGPIAPLESVIQELTALGYKHRRLPVATAFHTPIVAPAAAPFRASLDSLAVTPPNIPVYSTVTAAPYPCEPEQIRDLLARQLAEPVRFSDQIEAMYAAGTATFVEVGPGAALTELTERILAGRPHLALSMDRRGRHGITSFWEVLGALAVAGHRLNFEFAWQSFSGPRAAPPSNAATLQVDGSTFGRPYPPTDGSAMPPPNRAPAVPRPVEVETDSALAGPISGESPHVPVVLEALRRSAEAHAQSQQAMAAAQAAYFRHTEALLSAAGVAGVRSDLAPPMSPAGPALAAVEPPKPKPKEARRPRPEQPAAEALAAPTLAATNNELTSTLLAIVADKTGYPMEMLDPAMELQADLGVDAIKRVEILAAFRETAPGLPEVDPRDLAGLRTLRAILDRLNSAAPAGAMAPSPDSSPIPASAQPSSSGRDLAATLLTIVADKTGYPVEMLDPEMELEADLGVDSIKRVEILAAFRETAPGLPEVDPRDLAGLRTLRAILDRLNSAAPSDTKPAGPATRPAPRSGVVAVAAREGQGRPTLLPGMSVAIVGDGAGIAAPFGSLLRKAGLTVLAPEAVAAADAVIALQGLEEAKQDQDFARLHLEAFAAARAFAARATNGGGSFVTVQDTGGDFCLSGDAGEGAWLGGMAGLAKTAATEWPHAIVRAIDLQRGAQGPQRLAERLLAALLEPLEACEVGLREDGSSLGLAEAELGAPSRHGPPLTAGAVLVASGGARGVVAACLRALTPRLRPRLLLLGRTPLEPETDGLRQAATPAEVSHRLYDVAVRQGREPKPLDLAADVARTLAAREIRDTLAALQADGAEARYRAVDVTDADAVDTAVAEARADWGHIDGVVHGAGVLADRLIADQTDDQFLRVFRTKVSGLQMLLSATRGDALSRICLFSSVAARYGNPGQAAYVAANEVLNKVAQVEAARRGPACHVMSLNWGPWDGGMVTPSLRSDFQRRGIPLIAMTAGTHAFVAEMLGGEAGEGAGPVEVILGGRLPQAAGMTT